MTKRKRLYYYVVVVVAHCESELIFMQIQKSEKSREIVFHSIFAFIIFFM